jgi:hypothetical protein
MNTSGSATTPTPEKRTSEFTKAAPQSIAPASVVRLTTISWPVGPEGGRDRSGRPGGGDRRGGKIGGARRKIVQGISQAERKQIKAQQFQQLAVKVWQCPAAANGVSVATVSTAPAVDSTGATRH